MKGDAFGPLRVPARVWEHPQVLRALHERDIGRLLVLLRQQAGFSQTQLGTATGLTQSRISELMNGKRRSLSMDVIERLADGLRMPDPCRMALGLAPKGRQGSRRGGLAGTVDLLRGSARSSQRFRIAVERARADAIELEFADSELRRLASEFVWRPAPEIVPDVVSVHRDIFNSLSRSLTHPNAARDLFGLAAMSCGLLAYLSDDLGFADVSRAHTDTALVCADAAGDVHLQAWIQAKRSASEYWVGDYAAATDEADKGIALLASARHAGTIPLRLAGLAARARARAGDVEGASASLRLAEQHERDSPTSHVDDIGGVFAHSLAKHRLYAGTTLIRIGESMAGEELALETIGIYDDGVASASSHVGASLAWIDAAEARLARGELDGVQEALQHVLTVPLEKRTAAGAARMDELRPQLQDGLGSSPELRELVDSIGSFGPPPTELPEPIHPLG